jgi:hypothetical protein
MANPFLISIEPVEGPSFRHGFHAGTIEPVARKLVEDMFRGRNARGDWTRTIALMRDGKLFDTFDGRWASDEAERAFAEAAQERLADHE